MFLHEAAIVDQVAVEKVNIGKASNRADEFIKLNPMGEVPALAVVGGDGVVTESLVICKYLDDVRTSGMGSPLHGETALARAETDMWCARVETKFLAPLFWAVRCGPLAKFFADRTPGYVHPEVSEPMGVAAKTGMAWLDAQLAADGRSFLCGERFTIADIRLYVNFKFLTGVHKPMAAAATEYPDFSAYIERVGARESALAIKPPARKK